MVCGQGSACSCLISKEFVRFLLLAFARRALKGLVAQFPRLLLEPRLCRTRHEIFEGIFLNWQQRIEIFKFFFFLDSFLLLEFDFPFHIHVPACVLFDFRPHVPSTSPALQQADLPDVPLLSAKFELVVGVILPTVPLGKCRLLEAC
jgi:hypothetical protein